MPQLKFYKKILGYRRVFTSAKRVLDILHTWREAKSGVLGTALATLASVDPLIDVIESWGPTSETLIDSVEYKEQYTGWSESQFVSRLLLRIPHETVKVNDGSIHFWMDGAIILCESKWKNVILFKNGLGLAEFRSMVQNFFYTDSRHLFLMTPSGDSDNDIDVFPYGPLPAYLAPPDPEEVASKLHGTLLLVGPSGVGKSLLARHVAEKLHGKSLTISGELLETVDTLLILMLVDLLRPEVLVLDDIPESPETRKKMLSVTEALHETCPASKVILTLMTEFPVKPKRGAVFINGLRPGRVDEVRIINPPDEERRRYFLKTFIGVDVPESLLDSLAKQTQDLSPAYLQEIANRVRNLGVGAPLEKIQTEIDSVLLFAPPLSEEEGEDDGSPKTKKPTKKKTRHPSPKKPR